MAWSVIVVTRILLFGIYIQIKSKDFNIPSLQGGGDESKLRNLLLLTPPGSIVVVVVLLKKTWAES